MLCGVAYDLYESGGYSPKLMKFIDFPEDIVLVNEEEDISSRNEEREKILNGKVLL